MSSSHQASCPDQGTAQVTLHPEGDRRHEPSNLTVGRVLTVGARVSGPPPGGPRVRGASIQGVGKGAESSELRAIGR